MDHLINEFADYLNNVKKTSENTCLSYKRDLCRMASFMREQGIPGIEDITADKLSEYVSSLQEENFAPSSVTRHITSIKAFFRYMVENGNISENPAEDLKSPKVSKSPPRILSTVEIEGLLSQKFSEDAKGKRDKAILELLYATGLKATEVINLKVTDVDLSLGCLRLKKNPSDSRTRLIPYGKKARDAVYDYLSDFRKDLLGDAEDDGILFLSCNGSKMSRQGLWKLIKTYVRKAGIDSDITVFTLRHSFATHLIENGADVSSVQELMGYSDSNTISRYLTGNSRANSKYELVRIRN